jgi:hypothetical protein
MLELVPCVTCQRHVSVRETSCPFCAVSLPLRRARYAIPRGFARAAVFSAALASCSSSKDREATPAGSAVQQGSDDLEKMLDPSHDPSARRAPLADAAVADAELADAAVDAAIDAGVDAGVARKKKKVEHTRKLNPDDIIRDQVPDMPYGAPPARRRVV